VDPQLFSGSRRKYQNHTKHPCGMWVQHIADHLTHSELTQAVHRNRALRYPNRTVITLTDVEVDYLPVTHEVTQFATLTEDGKPMAEAKLDQRMNALTAAAKRLEAQGIGLTAARLAQEARVRKTAATDWLRRWRGGVEEAV